VKQRWRGIRVEQHGTGPVAVIYDRMYGRELRVYFRRGRWRLFSTDAQAPDGTGAVAKRLIEASE
jgi:hypothetical protein